MTKIEAEAEVERLQKRQPKWFCPLIKDTCTKTCVNFVKPVIINRNGNSLTSVDEDEWDVAGYICANAMYIGNSSVVYCGNCGTEILMGRGDDY